MNTDDHVYLDDASGRHFGKVTTRADNGMCSVKWDSGITEQIHEDELHEYTNPYEQDDPKDPSWRERLATLWDSRPGK